MPVFLGFFAGFVLQAFIGYVQQPKVVVVDNGQIVKEVRADNPILVVKDGDKVELREVREDAPPKRTTVVREGPVRMYKDSWGNITAECKTCVETDYTPPVESVWASQKNEIDQPESIPH